MTMPPANEPIETAAGDRPPITIAKALEEVEQLEAAIDTEEGDEAEEDEGLVDRPSRALGLAEMPPSLLIALRALLDKQAQQLAVFNTEPLTPFYDFAVLANGLSPIQRDVLARTVREELHKLKVNPLSVEGNGDSGWILMDYRDFLIHILAPEKREYYHLETLWGDLPRCEPEESRVVEVIESMENGEEE